MWSLGRAAVFGCARSRYKDESWQINWGDISSRRGSGGSSPYAKNGAQIRRRAVQQSWRMTQSKAREKHTCARLWPQVRAEQSRAEREENDVASIKGEDTHFDAREALWERHELGLHRGFRGSIISPSKGFKLLWPHYLASCYGMKFKMTTDKCDTTVGPLKKYAKTRAKLYLQWNGGMEVDCKQVRHTVCCLSCETRVVHCAIWPRNWFSQRLRAVENLKWSDLFFLSPCKTSWSVMHTCQETIHSDLSSQ